MLHGALAALDAWCRSSPASSHRRGRGGGVPARVVLARPASTRRGRPRALCARSGHGEREMSGDGDGGELFTQVYNFRGREESVVFPRTAEQFQQCIRLGVRTMMMTREQIREWNAPIEGGAELRPSAAARRSWLFRAGCFRSGPGWRSVYCSRHSGA